MFRPPHNAAATDPSITAARDRVEGAFKAPGPQVARRFQRNLSRGFVGRRQTLFRTQLRPLTC